MERTTIQPEIQAGSKEKHNLTVTEIYKHDRQGTKQRIKFR